MTARLRNVEAPVHTVVMKAAPRRRRRAVARPRIFDVPDPTVTRTIVEIMAPTLIWTRSILSVPPLEANLTAAMRVLQYGLSRLGEQELRKATVPLGPDALAERRAAPAVRGRLVTTPRAWIRWAYPTLIGLVVALIVAAAIIEVPMYSTGVSIITVEGEQVTSPMTGTVAEVVVVPRARVTIGDPVLRLRALEEEAELAATETDYRNALATFLTNPGDDGVRTALAVIATRRQRAKAAVDARTLRAPVAGIVGDIRVRRGQPVAQGAQVMKISPSTDPSVVALLPGFDRPRLEIGMTLQIELPGYHKQREAAVIDAIGSQVIGPEEARKSLGDPIADALPISGPVVIVRAHLAARTFEAGGRAYTFHDGMLGKAEVRVDHESVLRALLPGNGE